MNDFIQKLKAKPVHVRESIAFGTAIAFTSLVAIVWLTTSLTSSSGFFAPMLSPTVSFENSQKTLAQVYAQDGGAPSVHSNLVGAASEAVSVKNSASTPRLQIVEVSHSFTSSATSSEERTVIPF